jgi:putative flippase GtrA
MLERREVHGSAGTGVADAIVRLLNLVLSRQFVLYVVVQGAGTALYIGLLALGVEVLNIAPVAGSAFAFAAATLAQYAANRAWVFQTTSGHGRVLTRFLLVAAGAGVLNVAIMFLTVNVLKWWYGAGVLIATAVIPLTNFLLNRFWAFSNRQAPKGDV